MSAPSISLPNPRVGFGDGPLVHQQLTQAITGWRTDAVYAACIEAGLGVQPVMGFGKSGGCAQANFSEVQLKTKDRKPGDGWFLSRRGKLWLVCADTDRRKAWEHDRWMTVANKHGCMTLLGQPSDRGDRLSADEKDHHAYARHITNEVEIEEPFKGGLRRRWKSKSENTHWLDASYYANVAANMEGIRLPGKATSAAARQQAGKPSKRKVEYL